MILNSSAGRISKHWAPSVPLSTSPPEMRACSLKAYVLETESWFISLGWIKIIPNTSRLHPLVTKGERERKPRGLVLKTDGLRPTTTALCPRENWFIRPYQSPSKKDTSLTTITVTCLWIFKAPQPGAPSSTWTYAASWQVSPTIKNRKLWFYRIH